MEDINFDAYIKDTKAKEKRKINAYKEILHGINQMISDALRDKSSVTCDVPPIMLEIDGYNPLEALIYIIERLQRNKRFQQILVDIKIIEPCSLYLKWDINKLKY